MSVSPSHSTFASRPGSVGGTTPSASAPARAERDGRPLVREFNAYKEQFLPTLGMRIAQSLFCVRNKPLNKKPLSSLQAVVVQHTRSSSPLGIDPRGCAQAGAQPADSDAAQPSGVDVGPLPDCETAPCAQAAASAGEWVPARQEASYWTWNPPTWNYPQFFDAAPDVRLVARNPVELPAAAVTDHCLPLPSQPTLGTGGHVARGEGSEALPIVVTLRESAPEVLVPPGPQRLLPQPLPSEEALPGVGVSYADFEPVVAVGPRRDSKAAGLAAFNLQAMDPRARSLLEEIKKIIQRNDSIRHAGREMHVKHADIGKLITGALQGEGGYAIDDAVVRDVLLLVSHDHEIDDAMRMHLFQQVIRPSIGLTRCLSLRSLQTVSASLRASQSLWQDTLSFGRVVSNLYDVHGGLLRGNSEALKQEVAAFGHFAQELGEGRRGDALRYALRIWIKPSLGQAPVRASSAATPGAAAGPGFRSPSPAVAVPGRSSTPARKKP